MHVQLLPASPDHSSLIWRYRVPLPGPVRRLSFRPCHRSWQLKLAIVFRHSRHAYRDRIRVASNRELIRFLVGIPKAVSREANEDAVARELTAANGAEETPWYRSNTNLEGMSDRLT